MKDKPFVIGVFVSSPSVGERIRKVATQRDNIIRVSYEHLAEAILPAKKMEQEGVEVVVSRRGTAYMLRESLRIPVISFPQSFHGRPFQHPGGFEEGPEDLPPLLPDQA